MRVIFTAGVFDLLHRGHLNMLWQSRQLGDVLVVGVVSDGGCAAYKGRLPVENVQRRMQAVEKLGFVDAVLFQATTDPSPILERIRPDIMTHGDDWLELKVGQDTIDRLGIEWRLIPYTPGISTTLLRQVG
jgi:rfaE bifunctional protein nucleotidyltransferase chain/domain